MAKLKIVKSESGETFKVEKGVPLTPVTRTRRKPLKYPIDKMSLGDSFAFDVSLIKNVTNCAALWGRRNGCKFSVRNLGNGLARCWRVE